MVFNSPGSRGHLPRGIRSWNVTTEVCYVREVRMLAIFTTSKHKPALRYFSDIPLDFHLFFIHLLPTCMYVEIDMIYCFSIYYILMNKSWYHPTGISPPERSDFSAMLACPNLPNIHPLKPVYIWVGAKIGYLKIWWTIIISPFKRTN